MALQIFKNKRIHPFLCKYIKRNCSIGHAIDDKLLSINNELALALQHLSTSIRICNPPYLDTNFRFQGIRKRPQYSCGYSKDSDIISIYFRHTDPTYIDIATDLNIKHQTIQLNNKNINIHSGFFSYLMNENNEFIENISAQLKLLKNTYEYDTNIASKTRLLVTGQSLGSALSQLFYLLMYSECDYYGRRLTDLIPANLDNVFVITFGSPSFVYCKDVEKYFKLRMNADCNRFYDLSQRIFNFHDENDPVPMLLTGINRHLQTTNVSFREVVKCQTEKKLAIASNQHIGNNYALLKDKCINMEHDHDINENYLRNGANYLWNDKCRNMRNLLILFAKNHLPHQYKTRVQKIMQKS